MPKRSVTFDEVIKYLETLPYAKFKQVVEHYSSVKSTSFEHEMDTLVTLNFEQRLQKININQTCPKCNSISIVKNGKKPNGIQSFKCKDCSCKFTLFTNTILEKTRWHWDIWIKVLEMTLNDYSIDAMINVLEKDYGCSGINRKTVWLWRMKLIHVLGSFPMPKLTGVIQIDETFVRESQKGSRNLVSYIDKTDTREARYGYRPSKYGVMGPEFATITTAIDNKGHCVCKVSALGKLTNDVFVDLFEEHLDKPAYICTDANDVYENYCNLFNIPHYVKPSNYNKLIKKNGHRTPNYRNPTAAKTTELKNNKILEKLYYQELIDRITNKGPMSYEEFNELKNTHSLSLARVNELHSDIKKFIYRDMTNVGTKYLQAYIGFYTFKRNWRIDNDHYPSSKSDAETIFIEILKAKKNYTITDVKEEILTIPKPTNRYITLLKAETEKARKATSNKYFKFNEEDGVKTFNKREYLLDQPKSKLHAICKECKLKKYKKLALWSLVSLILTQPNVEDIIYKLLEEDRYYKISEEDLKYIKASKYRH